MQAGPPPGDPFERNLAKTQFFNPYVAGIGSGFVAAVALFRDGILVACLGALSIGAASFLIFWGQRRAVRWLGEMHGWDYRLRGFLEWLILMLPILLLLAVVAVATAGRQD
jgi:hypothetical protein